MSPITCKTARIDLNGSRYRLYKDGSVSQGLTQREAMALGCKTVKDALVYEETKLRRYAPGSDLARAVRKEAKRLRRNRVARERRQAMKDLGLVMTPYGWE